MSSCIGESESLSTKDGFENTSNNSKPKEEFKIISEDWYSLDVPEGEGAIIRDYVNDPVTAQVIGDAVIKAIVGDKIFNSLSTVNIYYDEENGIWLVNRNYGDDILGGDYTCFIKKSNGEILKVITGE